MAPASEAATHAQIEFRAYEIFLARAVHTATIWPTGSRPKGN
jgi:hypothetical protein